MNPTTISYIKKISIGVVATAAIVGGGYFLADYCTDKFTKYNLNKQQPTIVNVNVKNSNIIILNSKQVKQSKTHVPKKSIKSSSVDDLVIPIPKVSIKPVKKNTDCISYSLDELNPDKRKLYNK